MANNIVDGGLNPIGTYDPTTDQVVLSSAKLNLTSTNLYVSGVTAVASGTFSGGGTKVVTVTNGIITKIQ